MGHIRNVSTINFIRLFTLLLLAIGLTGCSPGNPPFNVEGTGNTTPMQNPAIVNPPDGAEDGVVITFSTYEFYRPLIEPIIAEFHENNPSITVRFLSFEEIDPVQTQDEAAYYLSLTSSADSLTIGGRSSIMSSHFFNLQPFVDSDQSLEKDDFWPGSLSACQAAEGEIAGLPLSLFFTGMFYDRSAFDSAGITYPQPGWTWSDFTRNTSALTQTISGNTRYGFADRSYLSILHPLIADNLAENGGKINAAALTDLMQWYVDLSQAGKLSPFRGVADPALAEPAQKQWEGMFQRSQPPAMWFGRLIEPVPGLAGVSEDTDPSTHLAISAFGFAPMPIADDGSNMNTSRISGECAGISAGSQHPQATWEWLKFLSHYWLSDKSQPGHVLRIPARQSVAAEAGFWDLLPENAQETVRYGLEHAWYAGLYAEAEKLVLSAVEKATNGQIDLAAALQEARSQQGSMPQVSISKPEIIVKPPEPVQSDASRGAVINFSPGVWTAAELTLIKALIEQFNREHKDEVEVRLDAKTEQSSSLGYYEGLAAGYDCFVSQVDPANAAASGAVLSLNSFLDGENSAFRQDYDRSQLDVSRYEGELYDLPLVIQPPVMVYNADLLAKRGLQPPSNDWTLDGFLSQITAATSVSEADKSYGLLPESQAVRTIEMLYAVRNTQWLDSSGDLPAAKFDTPDMAAALNWLAGLYRSGILFQSASGEAWWLSITKAVQSGQVAYWSVLAGEQNSMYFGDGEPYFRVGIAPLPQAAGSGQTFGKAIEKSFYISSQSQNSQACWSLAKYLSEQTTGYNGVPARKSVANSAAWETGIGTGNAEIYRLALARVQTSNDESYLETLAVMDLGSWIGQAQADVQNGGDAQLALLLAQQKADIYHSCLAAMDVSGLSNVEIREKLSACARQADPAW